VTDPKRRSPSESLPAFEHFAPIYLLADIFSELIEWLTMPLFIYLFCICLLGATAFGSLLFLATLCNFPILRVWISRFQLVSAVYISTMYILLLPMLQAHSVSASASLSPALRQLLFY